MKIRVLFKEPKIEIQKIVITLSFCMRGGKLCLFINERTKTESVSTQSAEENI
jgi:hypothetical protein